MSMKVFHAYLFKENAEFKDLQEARQYINDLREKFIKWVPTDMIKWTTIMKLSRAEQMEKLEKDTQDPEIGGVWDYQLQCVMFAREVDGVNYIALQFFPSRPVVKFLKENVKLRSSGMKTRLMKDLICPIGNSVKSSGILSSTSIGHLVRRGLCAIFTTERNGIQLAPS